MTDDIKEAKEIRKLTAFEKEQLEFLVKEYPMLPEYLLETMIRLTEEEKNRICDKMKSGELKMEEALKPEEYIKQSVKVSDPN